MFKKRFTIFLIILFSVLILGFATNSVLALDVGTNYVSNNIALGDDDPREVAARVINILMSILGLLAVVLIIYAGFRWMTADGDEENVRKAKRILINAVIGLAIILASWGIATFVINQLLNATGVGTTTTTCCIEGTTQTFGCGGEKTCQDDCTWDITNPSNCTTPVTSCDGNSLTPVCDQDDTYCAPNYFCNTDCFCEQTGNIGDPCDGDLSTPDVCDASDNMCGEYLTCDADADCTCQGSPVITAISPFGGFCKDDENTPCKTGIDCESGVCDDITPNGATSNLISIHGHNFSSSTVTFNGGVDGVDPASLNADCAGVSNNNLIIVAVPEFANSGVITVTNEDGKSDNTNNTLGPVIEDFVKNTITRPGLCSLTPDSAQALATINYSGLNLNNARAYFGNYNTNVSGFNNVFIDPDGKVGSTDLPNISNGETSSFATKVFAGIDVKSNFLDFVKETEEDLGPYISSFFDTEGPVGQYVTIYGSGFGNSQGSSSVYFGDIEASYDFPDVCADSVWSDNMVIVKVPNNVVDGFEYINMEIGSWEIQSSQQFEVDNDLNLKPSLCKISPKLGPHNSSVSLWGEYFGTTGENAEIIFTASGNTTNSNQAEIETEIDAQKLSTIVPDTDPEVVSGPVKVENLTNNETGNSLNFEVGECEKNADCGADVCCPSSSSESGRCVEEGPANDMYENCFSDIPSSVFQWNFNTVWENINTYDSCLGMARALGACQESTFCPNAPGQCSPYEGGEQQIVGDCNLDCSDVLGCGENCTYLVDKDKCQQNGGVCDLPQTNVAYTLGEAPNPVQTFYADRVCNNNGHWQMQVNTSCPDGWTNKGNGICVDENSTCELCSVNFNCFDDGGGQGICLSDKLCPSGSSCTNNGAEDKCIYEDNASCDCCCRVELQGQDCCDTLDCTGTCGSDDDATDDEGFGVCSGCNISNDPNVRDAACNCLNTSGKYCDITNPPYPNGACLDCAKLSEDSCTEHETTCCWDKAEDICRGGSGVDSNGYCSYYDCDDASGSCSGPEETGDYRTFETCEEACGQCSTYGDENECIDDGSCCWDENDASCSAGARITSEPNLGYCDYYDCNDVTGACTNPSNPLTSGEYETWTDCNDNCEGSGPPGGFGNACVDDYSGACDLSLCSNPFNCLDNRGDLAQAVVGGDCGVCCCDPKADPEDDVCKNIGDNLNCVANKGNCTTENRGLCCGCSNDSECGDSSNIGCGLDTCCHARPQVVEDQVKPSHGESNVCRNAVLEVPFNQNMKASSFFNNFILLQELDQNKVCPSGTFLVNLDYNYKEKWWQKITRPVARIFNSTLSSLGLRKTDTAFSAHPIPQPENYIYCQVPGSVSRKIDNGNSVLVFIPNNVLASNAVYYGIVKGDKDLNSSSGVLSVEGIGLNGEGYLEDPLTNDYIPGGDIMFNSTTFVNSYIWTFKTLSEQGNNDGLCEVNYIRVRPDDYLFQNTQDNIFEDDNDFNSDTYDNFYDRDKSYNVNAYSISGQVLQPIANVYDWSWDWSVEDINIANISQPNNCPDNSRLVKVTLDLQEGNTKITATIDFDEINNVIPSDDMSHTVPLYVFACQNPWPSPNPITHAWMPWSDADVNCDFNNDPDFCKNFNYTLYYCRDAGEPGTFDDLPALSEDLEDVRIRGLSNICSITGEYCGPPACPVSNTCQANTCSITGNYCEAPADCLGDFSNNTCVPGVLKDYYFFRAEKPSQVQFAQVEDLETGGSLKLYWQSPVNMANRYKVYYRKAQDSNFSNFEVYPSDPLDPDIVPNPVACITIGGNYHCQRVLHDLQNNNPYYFRISSVNENNVESQLSNQLIGEPSDATAPATPLGVIIY
ncbi:MAG: IPT/TIG domain-containing protein [Candidatus Pacebacteria bacterium]|nr:IPT/TIG domain-containing protein [Candidatus Paceibacterota bacterium]